MSKRLSISFDKLSPCEFEKLCYDLLLALGFKNLNWRKGTGYAASPSDQGRDIECQYTHKRPDGEPETQTWFVECKHYKKGVPPKVLEAALSWAHAKQPHKLLFVVSNFLSNQAKEYLDQYRINNKPKFEINVWERPKLEQIIASQSQLLVQYGLTDEFPYLSIMHPAHIRYLKYGHLNTLKYFFQLLEGMESKDCTDALDLTMLAIIAPRFKHAPPDFKGTLGDLMLDRLDYPSFKEKCYQLAKTVEPHFVVLSVVNHVLQCLLHRGDTTAVDIFVGTHNERIDFMQKRIDAGDSDAVVLADLIKRMEQMRDNMPESTQRAYELYVRFCQDVVIRLFDEDVELLLPKKSQRPTVKCTGG